MKITELMIGDWVSYKGHPVLVEALNKSNGYAIEKDMISIKLNDDTCLGINADRLEPIPLTEDILIKNGYKRDKHQCYYPILNNPEGDFMTVYFVLRSGEGQWFMGVDTGAYESPCFAHCDYVHKFQHLLRDIDEDKELEL